MQPLFSICKNLLCNRFLRFGMAVAMGSVIGITAGYAIFGRLPGLISVVQGSSMAPTFEPGARLYTTALDRLPRRGDIVLIGDGEEGRAIKRIIGMPGEKVHLWRGQVFINGRLLREPYLPKYTFTHVDQVVKKDAFALGSGNYFVLGDNRCFSYDSRIYGPICQGSILGLVPEIGALPPEFAPFALPVHAREGIQRAEESNSPDP